MRRMVLRATCWKSTLALVVISPASTTRLSFTSVSAATRERGSWARIASSTASEIWSATLSGWPSETDSEVKRCSLIVLYRLGEIGSEETARISNNLASIPRFSPPHRSEIAAPRSARRGNRPRLGGLWDIPHLPQAPAREPGAGRIPRCAHAPRHHRGDGADGGRAARAVVPPAGGSRRAGARDRRRGGRSARRDGAAAPGAVLRAAHGLL